MAGAPRPRIDETAVWTGTEMLVWGGFLPDVGKLGDGGAYDPSRDTWRPLPTTDEPSRREQHAAVWTGSAMLIWGGDGQAEGLNVLELEDGFSYFPPGRAPSSAPRDARYFPQTGFRIDDQALWQYVTQRGGVGTFGYPMSRTFLFQGFRVQFFQRFVLQTNDADITRPLSLLEPGLLDEMRFNGSLLPAFASDLVASAPRPTQQATALAWGQQHAPDTFSGEPVGFYQTFRQTVPLASATAAGGDEGMRDGMDLDVWGLPTSPPQVDPTNNRFIYLRWQHGVMQYDAGCQCTQGALMGDYLKAVLTGQQLPADLAQQAQGSAFFLQDDPTAPGSVRDPALLPQTDLTEAFVPE